MNIWVIKMKTKESYGVDTYYEGMKWLDLTAD
jgi:hypothetical protein